jgi:predicted deacylase
VRRRVPIGQLLDGTAITIPLVEITGSSVGPTVYVQAGVHGDEATGIAVVLHALPHLTPDRVIGRIRAVPVANPAAFLTRSRGFLVEERGPIDLNRGYPGVAGGLLSDRILDYLFRSFVLQSDVTIDIHSALAGCGIAAFSYVDPDDDDHGTLAARERLAAAFTGQFLYRKPRTAKLGTSDMSRSLAAQADQHGKVVMSLELGEGDRLDDAVTTVGVDGLLNVLRAAGVLRGSVLETPPKTSFSTIRPVHAEVSGLFRAAVRLGQPVAVGDCLGEVIDVLSQRSELVTSPASGHVLRLMHRPFVMSGAELAWIVA